MKKTTYFFIDDVIWVMRDLTRKKPTSMFDNPFLSHLKEAHDKYGMKVQLNLFYRTDFFYGNDEFTLSDMTDAYKAEWEEASDWLKLAFHAKQEFPDYPYVNATYEDVKANYELIVGEIKRFAGEKSVSTVLCPHWLPVSRQGCHALADCGVKLVSPSAGDKTEYNGDPSVLPYGHAFRLLQNRQPETGLFTRGGKNTAIASSVCGYNHVSAEQMDKIRGTHKAVKDEETGLMFRQLGGGPTLNLHSLAEVGPGIEKLLGNEFIGLATHEQYFYEDYFAYQPEYAAKTLEAARVLSENGYTFINGDDMIALTTPLK
ncbi:MAG: hypothetical protein E7390_08910 [Ruminococcaceae bacterium]|nr:hypothetical protein [Oscillospiraceae bacterium]